MEAVGWLTLVRFKRVTGLLTFWMEMSSEFKMIAAHPEA